MKKYRSFGELLIDYRIEHEMSQLDLASQFEVDVRTVQRWEKDETLVKPEKEKDISDQTLLPYQLIRNLNAVVPIPTYYDFRIRKYSLSELNKDLPDAIWLKDRIDEVSKRIRTIDADRDIELLWQDLKTQKMGEPLLSMRLLQKACQLLPELNLIILDKYGNYSGHSIFLPISNFCYSQLLKREIRPDQIHLEDLVTYKQLSKPVFLNYDITADCNDNIFFLSHQILNFFKDYQLKDYIFCSYTARYDSFELNKQIELDLAWEEEVSTDALGLDYHPRFYHGNLKAFLSGPKGMGYQQL